MDGDTSAPLHILAEHNTLAAIATQVQKSLKTLFQAHPAAYERINSYLLKEIRTAHIPASCSLFGNTTSNMVEIQNLILLPARRMKSLFASLLITVITIRRRYLSYASSARLQSFSINSGGDACPWPPQNLSRQAVSFLGKMYDSTW